MERAAARLEAKLYVCRDVVGDDPRTAAWAAERQARAWEEARALGCGHMDSIYEDNYLDWYFILPLEAMKKLLLALAGEGYGPFTLDAEEEGAVRELEALGAEVVAVVELEPIR